MVNLQYLYMDKKNPTSKYIFQDKNSQVLGIKFQKKHTTYFDNKSEFEFTKNSCIYFLYNDEEIYIGKSVNGIDRIKEHKVNKKFWNDCLMIVTDNKTWTSTIIDYLEYHFINKFKINTNLSLSNKDLRVVEPNITLYDKVSIDSAIETVEFYLATQVINVNIDKVLTTSDYKIYENKTKTAKIIYDEENFILLKGSQLKFPTHKMKDSDNSLYERLSNDFKNFIENEIIDENYILLEDIPFKYLTRIAMLCAGYSVSGWVYFTGVEEIRVSKEVNNG